MWYDLIKNVALDQEIHRSHGVDGVVVSGIGDFGDPQYPSGSRCTRAL
jgi:hypothetical protein